jgi:hypothetical protein
VVEVLSAAGFAMILGCVNFACASTYSWDEPIWTGGEPAKSTLLKLGVVYSTFEYADGTRNYKSPPKVDSNLVQQINQVRQAVPSWRGLPQMVPGASGISH